MTPSLIDAIILNTFFPGRIGRISPDILYDIQMSCCLRTGKDTSTVNKEAVIWLLHRLPLPNPHKYIY